MSSIALAAAAIAVLAPAASAITNYAADFVAPDYVVGFKFPANTVSAQQTIIQWANERAKSGPWSVTNKPFAAPSGDLHDYLSMAPYYWPNCQGVGNTTVLSIPEMQKQCQYENRDGELNPDARLVNNIGDFDDLADAVLYNSLAWGITRDSVFSQRVASFVDAWFLNENTYMNPNLNYAQLRGGPDGQTGAHTGLLDLKSMSKIASGVLTLRQGNADGWNATIDDRFKAWVTKYIDWATTAPMALEEKAAANNHGSFYYTQLASLHVLNNDKASAAATVQEYFEGIYKGQIDADGNQPLENARTRPYHYLAYNLVAMMTNLRIGLYAGYDGSTQVTTNGGTIPKAAEYAMAFPPKDETASELFPPIQAVGAVYGDPDGKYAAWLNDKSSGDYVKDAAYFWNQPLGDSGVQQLAYVTYQGTQGLQTVSPGTQPTGGVNAEGVPTPGTEVGATGGAGAGPGGSAAGPAETGGAAPKGSAGRAAAVPLGAVLVAGAGAGVVALFL